MKKFSASLVSALMVALLVATTVFAAFTNGDFEGGDFTGWSKATFLNGLYPTRNPGGSDLTVVLGPFATQSQSDPHTNGNLLFPPYGQYVARVNSDLSYAGGGFGRNGNTLSQLATVEAGDVDPADSLVHVRFVYAGVMVNPLDHSATQKPYIYVVVKNQTKGDDILFEFQSYAGEVGKGWVEGPLFGGVDHWQYLDWQYVDIAESVAHPVDVGDVVYVEVTAAGCQPSGHPGYAYVDEFSFLKPAPIITVTDSPDPVVAGATLTYTFNYRAINAVDNPVIYIPIPAQTTFSSISDPVNCTYDPTAPASVTCNMASLAAGASGPPFTMNVTVSAGAGGSTLTLQNYTIQGDSTKVNTGSPVDTTVLVPPNTSPTAVNDTYTTKMSVAFTGATVLGNDTDPDSDPLTADLVAGPAHASAFTFNTDGTFTYEPENGFRGTDTFTYVANDGLVDSNVATVSIDVSPLVITFRSLSWMDGWILEYTETSNMGGKVWANQILRVGDSAQDQQYRSILSFNVKPMSAAAVIVSASVKLNRFDVAGVNPLMTHGRLIADVRKGFFGISSALEPADFNAAASKLDVGRFTKVPGSVKWYQLVLIPADFTYINVGGLTQFRLRFGLDDNDNGIEDWIRFASGNSVTRGRPSLTLEYYIPHP